MKFYCFCQIYIDFLSYEKYIFQKIILAIIIISVPIKDTEIKKGI